MQTRAIGAAYEERQRQHNPYPSPYQQVLRTLKAIGPMRSGRIAAVLGLGPRRMEQTCEELLAAGQVTKDEEAFYAIAEAH